MVFAALERDAEVRNDVGPRTCRGLGWSLKRTGQTPA
jgi:hypothetical protein